MPQVPSLALDPIGEFLGSRHSPGTDSATLERERVQLARFRHAFPGLSLQRLGVQHLIEHVEAMRTRGEPASEVAATSELCHAFIRFARTAPELGSGLLRLPDADVGGGPRENPYMLQAPPPGVTSASTADARERPGVAVAWLIILGFLTAVAAAVYLLALRE